MGCVLFLDSLPTSKKYANKSGYAVGKGKTKSGGRVAQEECLLIPTPYDGVSRYALQKEECTANFIWYNRKQELLNNMMFALSVFYLIIPTFYILHLKSHTISSMLPAIFFL